MKKLLGKTLKFSGYGLFFVTALLFFIYMTLPLDTVENYLVRLASDEYNTDLSIEEFSTWRLSGVEAAGITLTPRPTVEELEEIREARQAREAWTIAKEAKKKAAKKKAEGGEGEEEEPPKKVESAKDTADALDKPDDKTSKKEMLLAKAKAKVKSAKAKKAKTKKEIEDTPPAIPRGPQPLHIDELRAKVGPLDLLRGVLQGRLETVMLGGSIEGDFAKSDTLIDVDANWTDLDLSQLTVLENVMPLPLIGGVNGTIDLEIPVDEKGRTLLSQATGHVDIKIQNAAVGPGKIESKKLGAFPYFEVPRTRIAELGGRLTFEKKRATFEDFVISGKDLEGEVTGYIRLKNTFKKWSPRAHLSFRFNEAFLMAHKAVKTAMTSIPYIKKGQRDGYTGFKIGGTMAKPSFTPRPASRGSKSKARKSKRKAKKPVKTRRGRAAIDKKKRDKKSKVKSRLKDRKRMRDLGRPDRDTKALGSLDNTDTTDTKTTDTKTTDTKTVADADDEEGDDEEDEEDEEDEKEKPATAKSNKAEHDTGTTDEHHDDDE